MELRDLFVTPLVIVIAFVLAYVIRPYATDENTRKYFIPALLVKIVGAIAIGMIYQFYYSNGDTFMYHTYGSRQIWEACFDSPSQGFALIFKQAGDYTGVYKYASRVYFYNDPQSYEVIRMAAIFDLFTYSSYSATATLFALLGFVGTWLLYLTFYKQFPHLHRGLAIAICFIPSVFFWGSGILKETIVMAGLGIATYMMYCIFFERKIGVLNILLLLVALYFVFSVKKFILQAYLPAAIVWISSRNLGHIRSVVLKIMVVPIAFGIVIFSAYYSVVKVGEGDARYSINKIAETAKVTAYDIRYWSGREAGSGYSLGELDGTFGSMVRLAPQAINVTLFRPYLWEVKNPLMLLSALEGFVFLLLTLYIIVKKKAVVLMKSLLEPNVIFCLVFALSFAFAVGVSTYNFGTLARYKIPLLPFFAAGLVLILNYENRDVKLEELDETE